MGSHSRLWGKYGEVRGWPPATMTYEADRQDLARHEREAAALERCLAEAIPRWLADSWGFGRVDYL